MYVMYNNLVSLKATIPLHYTLANDTCTLLYWLCLYESTYHMVNCPAKTMCSNACIVVYNWSFWM